jgi:hypothetical protein
MYLATNKAAMLLFMSGAGKKSRLGNLHRQLPRLSATNV